MTHSPAISLCSSTRFSLPVLLLAMACGAVAQSPLWVDRQAAAPCGGALLFDEAQSATALLGSGSCQTVSYWNGGVWTSLTPNPTPPATYRDAVYDSVRDVVVAVTGTQSTGLQTWEWDGSTWSMRASGGLPARQAFKLVFDVAHNQTLLFGGNQGGNPGFADLWAWNGSSWSLLQIGGPTPRWNVAMTYDHLRQTVLLFGGRGEWQGAQDQPLADTWEWNGSYWFLHFGVASPPARELAGLAFDRHRNRAVLLGGIGQSGLLNDTWEWGGAAWTQVAVQGPPNGFGSLSYDPMRGVMVAMRGGSTWEYVADANAPASFSTYGAGCVGPAGVPSLDHVSGSLPRIGSVLQMTVQNLPASVFNVAVGFWGTDASSWAGLPIPVSLTPLGFTGCDAWLAPLAVVTLNNTAGTAAWNVPIPMNALALGADLYFQAGVLVPGWNPGGFVFSNAGHAVVGLP
ncbi:MAG: hypothetical protein R3F29_00780 [Planctomycetota bacterium]